MKKIVLIMIALGLWTGPAFSFAAPKKAEKPAAKAEGKKPGAKKPDEKKGKGGNRGDGGKGGGGGTGGTYWAQRRDGVNGSGGGGTHVSTNNCGGSSGAGLVVVREYGR